MLTRSIKFPVLTILVAGLLAGFSLPAHAQAPDTAEPAVSQVAAPAAPKTEPPAAPPVATMEQRMSGVEAYFANGDPTAALKDKDGKIPDGLTMATVGVPGPGHNGWMLTATALVLFMTLPGLALFYGGLVRRKNVLSVLAQCFGITGVVTILWWAFGYSVVFDHGSPYLGGFSFAFLKNVTSAPNTDYSYWVSHNVFSMYQMMFAIITPALIIGAIAERMKFSAVIVFMVGWMIAVYFPLAHMVWGIDGLMNGVWNSAAKIKSIDFAGGMVVHMSSGWSALILCALLGKRLGYGTANFYPHSTVLCAVGTGMLWVGWYGFNAGSAVAADGIAANAFMTTTLATAVACSTWGIADYIYRGKVSVVGFCSGAVAGLVVITPAAGFVNPSGSILIGLCAGIIPYFVGLNLKSLLGYDDALDTFAIHAIGGTLGAILTGFLANGESNPNLATNLKDIVGNTLWIEQLKSVGVTIALSVVGTMIVTLLVKGTIGLRVTAEAEEKGLDTAEHGEMGYSK
jgi:ammonium transporter, Amt family